MAKKDKPQQRKSKEDLAKEEEKLRILAKTDEIKGEQLVLSPEGEALTQREIPQLVLGNVENPEHKHELYYKGIQRLLIANLPKGKAHQMSRKYIYEEKNTYMTRGKRISKEGIRGADGRMGYTSDAEEMLQIVMDWIASHGTMVELYNSLRELNIKKGYGTAQH